jgi:hypothetical protein
MSRVLAVAVSFAAFLGMAFALPAVAGAADAAKKGKGKKNKVVTVCKFGCKYKSVQKAVDKTRKNWTIKVKPGTYKEGVKVEGKKHNGLTIKGTNKNNPKKVMFNGKNAKDKDGNQAQNAIEGIDVKKLTIKHLSAKNYVANGFFLRDSDAGDGDKSLDCRNYTVKNTWTSFNRAYNVFAFGCVGGKMVDSESTGTGDSAFYVGATPPQKKPKETEIARNEAYLNNQAFSGTNSRYVDIHHNDFYNNGIGITPNTLDSEPYEPAADSTIRKNNIFWNNLNYYLENSPIETTSNGLGEVDLGGGNTATINFPTGIGIVNFGVSGWTIKNNNIFGHFKWGTATFSDPIGNVGDDAISTGVRHKNNNMGRNGTDTNAVDFFYDGSGSGNCWQGNSSSTFVPSGGDNTPPIEELYPTCPAPAGSGTGGSAGDVELQLGDLLGYVLATPPENQQCSWTEHPHPKFKKYKPVMVTPGPQGCTS